MMNKKKPTIKKYITALVISATIGVVIGALLLTFVGKLLGFSSRGVLVILLIAFPAIQFSILFGFYKGLVKHYGLQLHKEQ
jgi:hypothetical protein